MESMLVTTTSTNSTSSGESASNSSITGSNSKKKERLFVRVDQPIEGMTVSAHTLLRGVDGGFLPASSRQIQCNWYRSVTKRTCANPTCRNQREAAIMEELVSGRRFCSAICLRAQWKPVKGWRPSGKGFDLSDYDEDERLVWPIEPFCEDERWELVGSERDYLVRREDVGYVLKVECSAILADGKVSATTESEITSVVIAMPPRPPKRNFILSNALRNNRGILENIPGPLVRVMTYNILAEIYATKQIYPYCPMWALSWRYRKRLIMEELRNLNADVICMQEVQQDHFESFLPELAALGYKGVYKPKTREAMGPEGKVDGCATIYRESRCRLVETHEIEYNAMALSLARSGAFHNPNETPSENQRTTDQALKRLCKDNVAQISILEITSSSSSSLSLLRQSGLVNAVSDDDTNSTIRVCIANTHIFWDPEFRDVKLWQTHMLLRELERICATGGQSGEPMPLILCGDFNSTPDSFVVEHLANSEMDVKSDYIDPCGVLPPVNSISHSLNLASAYSYGLGQEPETTNYTGHYSGVLDYIWISKSSIIPISVAKAPDETTLRGVDDTPLPNSMYPSDHIPICADLKIVKS